MPLALGRLGLRADAIVVRNPPELVCFAESGGGRYRVAYNLSSEATSIWPDERSHSRLSTRRFLTGLHLAFGYPSTTDTRWFWAVIVDVMAGAMVLWGLSGLLMWRQMRSVRRSGFATLLLSIAIAIGLAASMYQILSK